MSYFSQAGDWVDVAAPGGDGHKKNRAGKHRQVFSTYTADPRAHPHAGRNPPEPGEDGKYYVGMSGTSMATPHVSGLIALMMSVRPQLNLQEAKAILQASGRTLPGSFYPKQQSISPRVRVVDALAALKKTLGQESDPQPGEPGEPGPPPVGGGDWTSLSWIAEPSLKKEEVRVEKIRIHFGFRDDWEWRPPPGSRLDLSDPTIANTLIKFNKKIIPGDRDSTAYMDLSLRVNGRIEDSHTVFFRRLTKEKPFVLFSWRRDPALGRNAELLLNLDQSQKKYSIRVRIFED